MGWFIYLFSTLPYNPTGAAFKTTSFYISGFSKSLRPDLTQVVYSTLVRYGSLTNNPE